MILDSVELLVELSELVAFDELLEVALVELSSVALPLELLVVELSELVVELFSVLSICLTGRKCGSSMRFTVSFVALAFEAVVLFEAVMLFVALAAVLFDDDDVVALLLPLRMFCS